MERRKYFCSFLVAASLVFVLAANSSAFLAGDVDNNGEVNFIDVLLVLRYCGGKLDFSETQKYTCDVKPNPIFPPPVLIDPLYPPGATCDIYDALMMLRMVQGL